MPEPDVERSLLRCTLRKSASVFSKLALYAAYIIDGVAAGALALYGAYGVATIINEPLLQVYYAIVSVACMVPWYVYVAGAVVAAVFGYSMLWCVAIKIPEEDWDYSRASAITWYEYLPYILLILPAIIEGSLRSDRESPKCNCCLQFIGAYLHYRKRIREAQK